MSEHPLSIYFQTPQGIHPDIEVISRASIAYSQLVKEMAYLIDPSVNIVVEVVSANEGSYGLNTLSKAYNTVKEKVTKGSKKHPKIAWLAAYVAFRIINNAVDWTQDQIMDWLSGKDAPIATQHLSTDQCKALAEDLWNMMKKEPAKEQVESFFTEISQDSRIEGLGITGTPRQRPSFIIDSNKFALMADMSVSEAEDSRVRSQTMTVALISPVLVEGERRWKFRSSTGEFGAPVKDQGFLNDVLSGRSGIELRAGLELEIQLEITESKNDGVWVVDDRSVVKVYKWSNAPLQEGLFSSAPLKKEPDDQG